jgi:hypothetical protein
LPRSVDGADALTENELEQPTDAAAMSTAIVVASVLVIWSSLIFLARSSWCVHHQATRRL